MPFEQCISLLYSLWRDSVDQKLIKHVNLKLLCIVHWHV